MTLTVCEFNIKAPLIYCRGLLSAQRGASDSAPLCKPDSAQTKRAPFRLCRSRRVFVVSRFRAGRNYVKMVLMSVLNNTLNNIVNAERRGKRQVLVRPTSKVVIKFLTVMMKHGTISLVNLCGDVSCIDA